MKNVTSPPFLCVEFKTRGHMSLIKSSTGSNWMGDQIKLSTGSNWMGDHIRSSMASNWMGDHTSSII